MTAWIIVLSVGALFGLLLLSPVRFSASFQEDWNVVAWYLFFRFQLAPEKPKKKKRRAKNEPQAPKQEKEPEKSSKLRDIIKERGVKGFLSFLLQIAKASAGGAKKIIRHLVIRRCSLTVTVGGEDAAENAMEYGYLCAAVYPAAGAVIANVKCKRHDIKVLCDYQKSETSVDFSGIFSIKLVFVLAAAATALIRFFKAEIKNRNTQNQSRQISE